jgi:hypothetical protein
LFRRRLRYRRFRLDDSQGNAPVPEVRAETAEFDLLCRAARPRPDLEYIAWLLRRGVDHSHLMRLADDHGVRPGLARALAALSWADVPVSTRTCLERFERDHLLRSLALSAELASVAALLAENRVAFATFKGPALALTLYGDLAGREYNDIDLLVGESDVDAAETLLGSLGYGSLQGDRAFRRAFLARQRQYALVRDGGAGAIDLHWDFSGAHLPFPLKAADAWRRLGHVSVGGRDIPAVTGEDLALVLAGHGTKESWRFLKWVRDFAWMIDRHRALDWSEIHRRARENGCGDTVLLGCAIVQGLLEVAAPDALAAAIAQSERVRSRASTLVRRMREGLQPSSLQETFADLDLCDGVFAILKGAVQLALAPTAGDHAALKLPQGLWPLYYVTRPFRLALNAFARPS